MTPEMLEIMAQLQGKRLSLENEKATQADMAEALGGFCAEREVRVAGGIIDFIAGTTGIEVKLKGQPAQIVRQLSGYAEDPYITGLVLVTARPISLPETIKGKPVAVFDLGRAWL